MNENYFEKLSFSYLAGDITRIRYPALGSEWRRCPYILTAHITGYGATVETESLGIQSCNTGQSIIILSEVPHRITALSGADYVARWSHLHYSVMNGIDLSKLIKCPFIIDGENSIQIGKINEAMFKLGDQKISNKLYYTAKHMELGYRMLSVISTESEYIMSNNLISQKVERISKVLEYIEENLSKDFSRDELANKSGLSPAQFHVVFQEITGNTPVAFVRKQRMNKAQQLLVHSDLNLKDIAGQIGYNDPYTFSRAFKKTIGISPDFYRKKSNSIF